MDILKQFGLFEENNPIDILGTLEEPLFHSKQIGHLLGIINIRSHILDFDDTERIYIDYPSKGGIQKTIFLTEYGLFRLIGSSKKDNAKKFLKWMINITKNLRLNGKYELNIENEIDKNILQYNHELKNHRNLIDAFNNKSIIYICRIKQHSNERFIIKIGSSQNIKQRFSSISCNYDCQEPILLYASESDNHFKFEKFIHNHKFINENFFEMTLKDGTKSKETYIVNDFKLQQIINIMKENHISFQNKSNKEAEIIKLQSETIKVRTNEIELEKLREETKRKEQENENLRLQIELEKIKYQNLEKSFLNSTKTDYDCSDSDISNESEYDNFENVPEEKTSFSTDVNINVSFIKKRNNGSKVPKVYQYNIDNLENPIEIYDSPAEVERTLTHLEISPSPLRNAAKNNTIYKGFRWIYVNRNEKPPDSIPQTVDSKHKSPEIKFLAMIDIKKTKILEVFRNQKEAVEARNLKSRSFTRAINQYSISSGHYWKFFNDCPEEMQQEYLSRAKLPEPFINSSGKLVQQIHPKTGEVIETYNSNRDVIKKFQMSSLTLKKVSESGDIHHGFKWKIIDK